MKNQLQPGDWTPRAIAVLVALRNGPLSARQLSARIADRDVDETQVLLAAMAADDDAMITVKSGQWYLDHDGLGWLQNHGLDAVPGARLWTVDTLERARRMVPHG